MKKMMIGCVLACIACSNEQDVQEMQYASCINDTHEVRITSDSGVVAVYTDKYLSPSGEECEPTIVDGVRYIDDEYSRFYISCPCSYDGEHEDKAPKWYLKINIECEESTASLTFPQWWEREWFEVSEPCRL